MASERRGDELIGKLLGTFEILEEIGRGGMATVYRARQLTMNRIVAMKVLPQHLLHDPGFFERFEREVKVISQLEHPHIVPIYEYGQQDGIPYIAMRYLGGGSLENIVRRGVKDVSELVKPLKQIAQALDYAHQRGIIHRDLKPGNILLDETGNAYLSDFGIARVLGSNMTGSMIIGTPAYMSPEQANGATLDGRSDVYALGIVLFELITGQEPYYADTPVAILLKHINEPLPPLSDYRQDIPPAVEAVLRKATAKAPEDRYPSASALIEALSVAVDAPLPDTQQDSTPTLAIASSRAKTAVAEKSPTPNPLLPAPPIEPIHTQTSRFIVVGAVLLLLLIGAGVLLSRSATPPAVAVIPTAFPQAEIITQPNYTVSIPSAWMPPDGFLDQSDDTRQLHIWQADDGTAFATLALIEQPTNATSFEAQIAAYTAQYYAPQALHPIDEATAENGTVRHSYWLETSPRFPSGQLDVFYLQHAPYFVVLELYSADSTENTLVPTLQAILDSLRITTPAIGA